MSNIKRKSSLKWTARDPFYKKKPVLPGFSASQKSLSEFVYGFYQGFCDEVKAKEHTEAYLNRHQEMMRENPLADPFYIQPHLNKNFGADHPLHNIIMLQQDQTEPQHPLNYTNLYKERLLKQVDRAPYIVFITDESAENESGDRLFLVLGELQAEACLNYIHSKEPDLKIKIQPLNNAELFNS